MDVSQITALIGAAASLLCTVVVGALTFFMKKTLASLEEADKRNAEDIKTLDKNLNDLKADLPLIYVTREDYIRVMNRVEDKLDQILYTHFSNSAKIDTAIIEQEAATFDSGLAQIKAAGITLKYCHAANTPATVRFPQYHYNMVRSLLLLVGYDWSVDQFNRLGLEKVLYWRGFVAQINEVKAGERFDYGLALTASRDMKVAVTSFGYSDGYPDDLPGNGGFVMIKGQKAPILSLNMDQGFVDITDIPDVCVNDQMLLIGQDGDEEVELTELLANSKHSGTYFLSLINHRVRRIFKR